MHAKGLVFSGLRDRSGVFILSDTMVSAGAGESDRDPSVARLHEMPGTLALVQGRSTRCGHRHLLIRQSGRIHAAVLLTLGKLQGQRQLGPDVGNFVVIENLRVVAAILHMVSSIKRTWADWRSPRAIQSRCIWPPERLTRLFEVDPLPHP